MTPRQKEIAAAYYDSIEEHGDDPGAAFAAVMRSMPSVDVEEVGIALIASADEANAEAEAAAREARIAEAEAAHIEKWAESERAKGRPEAELTWGNCVRETGILKQH